MTDRSQMEISIEDLARLFAQHMPHGRDIGMQMDAPSADGRTRMHLPPQPFLSGDASANFFFPGVLFSMADTACGMAVFRALGRYVPIATIDMRIDHLAPATMDADLVALAECYRMTQSIAFARCELLCGPQLKVVAIAVGTFMLQSRSAKKPGINRQDERQQ
ncbi:MAG: PaaI family thioesterase [Rhodoferax sp.]|nr:PaaI family thioesterase [Rhodoferax sp.]